MCVCMDAEAIIDKGVVLPGKETTIIVYTRKRKQKLADSAADGLSNSADGEPSLSKIHFFKDDNVTNQVRVDKLAGPDGKDRIFSHQKPLAVVSTGGCSEIDISKGDDEGGGGVEEVVADGLAEEGLSSGVKDVEDRLEIRESCERERCDDPVRNSDQEAESQVDVSSMQEVLKDDPLEVKANGEGESVLDCRGESSSPDISKEHNDGEGEEAVVDGLPLGLSSGVKEVEDRTQISCGNEDGLHIHASTEPVSSDNPVLNSDQEAEPQLDTTSMHEPDGPLELHPSGEGEPMLSDDDQELNSNHVNETSSDQALESSRRVELPDSRWEPPLSGGKVKLPSGATGPHSDGLDRHENHQDLDIPEAVLSKPLISMNEEKVYIALNESSSKDELLSLKRKLESELDQVRRVARKVDEKELQVAAYNERNMTNLAGFIGSDVSDFSVYDQPHVMIGHSSMDSVGHLETRSSGHLSVPVMENSHEVVETPNLFAQTYPTMLTSSVRSLGHLDTRPFSQFNGSLTENNHEDVDFVDRDKRTPKANPYYMNSDFYLDNDRLPPEIPNKMLKPHGASKKRRLGGEYEYEVSFGFGGDKDGNKLFKDCSNLLQRLMKHKNGWVFNNPVDPFVLKIPDYLDVIKHPMDLGTIKTRLSKKQYASAIEFTEDVRLVFSNAMTYNPKGHEVHTWAEELLKIFEDRWVSIENGYRRKKKHNKPGYFPSRRHDYPPAPFVAPVTVPPVHSPAIGYAQITPPMPRALGPSDSITIPVNPMVRPANYHIPRVRRTPALPKPKANEPNKREMTFEEKQRLSTNLQSLPADRLDAVVQIMKKRSTAISQTDDEIEVDIDGVDVETLWELDRYVTNFKKSYSKIRRRAEQKAQEAAAAAAAAAQAHITNQEPEALVSQNECITGGGNTNSAPIEVETHANGNASSSGSDSGSDSSSSSDSDSDSSSGDELDVGQSPGA